MFFDKLLEYLHIDENGTTTLPSVENTRKGKSHHRYTYILFKTDRLTYPSEYIEHDYNYPPNPDIYKAQIALWRIFQLSNIIMGKPRSKEFFEAIDDVEKEFEDFTYDSYVLLLNMDFEIERYFYIKFDLISSYIDRSFKDTYRNALELKTEKGRVDHINHWFFLMNYYKTYMSKENIEKLKSLKEQWNSTLIDINEKI